MFPGGGKCVVFGNSTGKRGKVVINGVKRGGLDVSLTLVFCFQGVTQEWISSVFEMFNVFWIEVLSLCWSWLDIVVGVELVVYDVWFAEDDNTGFLSVGLIFLIDYICKNDQYPCPWCQWVLKTKNMVNNIMWEELTKIEICENIWWIIEILCLRFCSPNEKFENRKMATNMFWWMLEMISLM